MHTSFSTLHSSEPAARDGSTDIARGIGITLVVLGHVLIGLQGALGATAARGTALILIYSFHMALFFAISGAYSSRAVTEDSAAFLARVWKSFVYPYILWSLVLLGSHYVMSAYTNNKVERFDPVSILYAPPAVMWFLYVLLWAFLIQRLAGHLGRGWRVALAALLCVGGYFMDVWLFGYLRFVGFFILAAEFGLPSRKFLARPSALAVSLAVLSATAVLAVREAAGAPSGYPAASLQYLPAAFAGIFLVFFVSVRLDQASSPGGGAGAAAGLLALLGRKSLVIFLMHILLTAGSRIALTRLGIANGWVLGLAGLLAGLFVPVCMVACADRLHISRYLGWSPRRGRRTAAA